MSLGASSGDVCGTFGTGMVLLVNREGTKGMYNLYQAKRSETGVFGQDLTLELG